MRFTNDRHFAIALELFLLVLIGFAAITNAASPVVDSFDTGITGWNTYAAGYQGISPDSNTANCFIGACAVEGTGVANVFFQAVKYGTPLNSGASIIYFRNDNYTGNFLFGVCTLNDATHCQSNATFGGTDAIYNVLGGYTDNTWHFVYLAFEDSPTTTTKIYCTQVDDANPSDCTWRSTSVTNGTQYGGVFLGSNNGMNAGAHIWWDQLGTSVLPPHGAVTGIIQGIPASGSFNPATTTTQIGAITFIDAADYTKMLSQNQTPQLVVILSRPAVAALGIAASGATQTYTFNLNTTDVIGTYSTSTPATLPSGFYTAQIRLQTPTFLSGVFTFLGLGWLGGATVIDATTTSFTVGTPSGIEQIIASSSVALANTSSSTPTTANDCLLLNLPNCVAYLFFPDPNSVVQYTTLGQTLANKPPFGYYVAISGLISSTTASTTQAAFTDQSGGFLWVAGVFGILIDGLALLVYVALGWWIFHRITRFDWQV